MGIENVKRTTEVSSHVGRGCEHCGESIGFSSMGSDISASINHYIEKHGYRLLHVGQQTAEDGEGNPAQGVVAILGHDDPPPIREVKVTFGRRPSIDG